MLADPSKSAVRFFSGKPIMMMPVSLSDTSHDMHLHKRLELPTWLPPGFQRSIMRCCSTLACPLLVLFVPSNLMVRSSTYAPSVEL